MRTDELLDRLEFLLQHGRRVPFSSQVMVDEEEALELVERLRTDLPEEIRQANWTMAERQRLIKEAHDEAARIIAQASRRAEAAVQESEVLRRAQREAERTVGEARSRADEIVREAEAYALEQLRQLEAHLTRTLGTVRRGVEVLQRGRPASGEEAGVG